MIVKIFTIGKNDAGQRLDRFLIKQGLTIGVIMKALRNKDVKINGKRQQPDYKLIEDDIIKVFSKDDLFTNAAKELNLENISTGLELIYEDHNILLIDKPVGMLCHDTDDSLINRIKAYLYKKGEFLPENENSFEPSLCNRIDRNTGGIVIAAKNAESLRVMNEKIKLRQVKKFYLCILTKIPKEKQATLTAFLEKDENTNTVKITDKKTAKNKTIITKYQILKENNGLALAEVELITGRTHQIRAHMAHIGCPLLGDGKYGVCTPKSALGGHGWKHGKQALYSYKLIFNEAEKSHLDYLDNRCFKVDNVWFLSKFNTYKSYSI